MPGGRPISGRDLQAALRRFGPPRPEAAAAALRAAIPDDAPVGSYEDLARAAPPERLGLTSGAHAALFGPLFGEFE
jgi:hypothetical protein